MWRVYLDVCCLNRPFDDTAQDRIYLEAQAVLLILDHFHTGDWQWISSEVVVFEIERTPDATRRARVQNMLRHARRIILVTEAERGRMQQLEGLGFGPLDALHIACAESAAADVFLSTDDRLCRLALRVEEQLRTHVDNPLTWLRGVITP
jgi:PIN domain